MDAQREIGLEWTWLCPANNIGALLALYTTQRDAAAAGLGFLVPHAASSAASRTATDHTRDAYCPYRDGSTGISGPDFLP